MKNRIIKKTIALTLSLSMIAISFLGCGEEQVSVVSNSIATNYSQYLTDEVSIDFECIWVGTDSKAAYIAQLIEAFNQQYQGKYQVNMIEQTSYDTYESKLKVQIAAGQVPDIFTVKSFADIQDYASQDRLMDFTSFLGNQQGNYNAGVLEEYAIDGKSFCIPFESGVVPIMYNMEILASAGYTEVPKSWEEFFEICDALQAMGMQPTSFMTGANAWTAQLWFSYALASVAGPDAWSLDINSNEYKKAAQIVKKIYSYAQSDAVGAEAGTVNNHFYNKDTAFYTNGAWILGGIKKNAGEDFYKNVQVSSGLSYNGKNGNSFINYIQAYICAAKQTDAKKQEAVEAFVSYLTDLDHVAELSESSGATFCLNIDTSKLTDPLQSDIVYKCNNADFTVKNLSSALPSNISGAFPAAIEQYVIGSIDENGFVKTLAAGTE